MMLNNGVPKTCKNMQKEISLNRPTLFGKRVKLKSNQQKRRTKGKFAHDFFMHI